MPPKRRLLRRPGDGDQAGPPVEPPAPTKNKGSRPLLPEFGTRTRSHKTSNKRLVGRVRDYFTRYEEGPRKPSDDGGGEED